MDKKESGLGVTDFDFAGSEFVWGELVKFGWLLL